MPAQRYQEKPRIVEAWQYDTGNYPMPDWLRGVTTKLSDGRLVVESANVFVVASLGDYLVRWPDGCITAYPADRFTDGFEAVE